MAKPEKETKVETKITPEKGANELIESDVKALVDDAVKDVFEANKTAKGGGGVSVLRIVGARRNC